MFTLKLILSLIIYSIACAGFGGLLFRLLEGRERGNPKYSATARLATSFLLGQGMLANLWILVALAGWFSSTAVIGGILICIAGGSWFVWPLIRDFIQSLHNLLNDLWVESFSWQVVAGLSLYLAMGGFTTLAAPLQGDAVRYYLTLPKMISASQHLELFPLMGAYSSFGLQGEMHYAALMALGLSETAQLFAWITGIAGALLLCALGASLGLGRRGQWLILAMVYSSTCVLWVMQGKTDLFTMALGIAAIYWVLQGGNLRLRLAGLFCGFALVSKLSYVITLVPVITFLVVFQQFQNIKFQWRTHFRYIHWLFPLGKTFLVIFFWTLLGTTVHLIKNGVLLGNPLALGTYHARNWGWDSSTLNGYIPWRIYLTYLIELTFGNYDRVMVQLGNLSPLILAFLPLGLVLPRTPAWLNKQLFAVTLAAALGTTIWVILYPGYIEPRYLLATLMLFTLLPARATEYIAHQSHKSRFFVGGVIGCVLITLSSVTLSSTTLGNNPVYFPAKTLTYLRGGLPECLLGGAPCKAETLLNREAKPGSRILTSISEIYWLRADLLQCAGNEDASAYINQETGELAWEEIYKNGFRYLLINKNNVTNINLSSSSTWAHPVNMFEEGPVLLYRLDYDIPLEEALRVCRQSTPNKWDVVSR